MQGNKIKKYLAFTGGAMFAAAAVALPIIAINNSTKNAASFDFDKIGVYVEKSWTPAYEMAIKKYNETYPDKKYDIQLLELGSFEVIGLIETLGYADQKIPDLIYAPIDRVPSLVESSGALVGFDSPEKLISSEFDPKIYDGLGVENFARKGEALIIPPNTPQPAIPQPYYFGVPHSTEALILYYKGFSEDEIKTIENVVKIVNDNQWKNQMYGFKFNDLWFGLGVIAGFLEAAQPGAGKNGQLVGKILVSNNNLETKFQSNMTNVGTNFNYQLDNYENTPGWTESGITIQPEKATKALQSALDFLASFYNSSKVRNELADTNGNDWLILDGDNFNARATELANKEDAKKAAIIDGPWKVTDFSKIFTDAVPVPPVKDKIPYLQAPGGWLYAINQRNATNPDKIRDIKHFLNILLSDEEVIRAQYQNAGKIIEGSFGKTILQNYAKDPTTPKLVSETINAVFNSQTMDQRPDGGNADFAQVWSRWDENGFRYPPTKDFLVNFSTKLTDVEVAQKLKSALAISFETMIRALQGKG